jgi:DNA-nicking Smr family endonuclease
MAGRARRAGRVLTAEEQALWEAVTRGMRRLHGARRAAALTVQDTAAASFASAAPAAAAAKKLAAAPPPAPAPLALDRRSAQKLRRGTLALDGRLDLHGMTQDEAFQALAGFIAAQARRGHKYVLVITGKGAVRSLRDGAVVSRPGGVLRDQVPKWLAAPALRRHVQAIQPAAPRHGGDGAVYVLLRRARKAEA